jgi:hypothetical protein
VKIYFCCGCTFVDFINGPAEDSDEIGRAEQVSEYLGPLRERQIAYADWLRVNPGENRQSLFESFVSSLSNFCEKKNKKINLLEEATESETSSKMSTSRRDN